MSANPAPLQDAEVPGQAADPSLPEDAPYQARLESVRAAANPLMECAKPLLRALADIPAQLAPQGGRLLRRLLDREVLRFQSLCDDAQIRHEHQVAASYALCTAIDEAASSTSWGGGGHGNVGIWSSDQLAVRFHGDNKGGDKLFLLLGRLSASPRLHMDLIEVLYTVLGLGFQGRYGTGSANESRRQLDTIRHRLFTVVAEARGEVPVFLSPHGRRAVGATRRFPSLRTLPFGWILTLYLMVLASLFAWYRTQLDGRSAIVREHIRAIGALDAPPKFIASRSLRLKALLEDEIARGNVEVSEDASQSIVSFRGDDMFLPGHASLNPRMLPLMVKLARELGEVAGSVRVTGHSDNQPIRTAEFPDNQHLSEKRAQAIAAALQAGGVGAGRLQIKGLGDTQPVADNRTVAGRARNRRVDVVLLAD